MRFDTTIIIPCYNEAFRFDTDLFDQYHKALPNAYFVFVNDGSTDHTEELLQDIAFAKANIHILSLTYNVGKGEAVRQGIRFALVETTTKYIGYFDADLATPLTEVLRLKQALENQTEAWIVLGSRKRSKNNVIQRRWYRHIPGRIFATLVNTFILKCPIHDTQCGAKLMRTSFAQNAFQHLFLTRWLFDIELIMRLEASHSRQEIKKRILELPVLQWTDNGASKIRFSDAVMIPFQLVRLLFK